MNARTAGDFDYDAGGVGYAAARRTDPRIAALVHAALGPARSVLNVGAGAGSYEPEDRAVTAVEPSASMRAQRPAHLGPAIDATAEHLPFADASFDAAMAMVTVHQWADTDQGLRELRRVSAGPGSYEPEDRAVTAIEPSASMRAQRPAHLGPAIDATAEHLPFADASFDAAMAMVTVHQWADTDQGLRELRRVSRGPVVVLTFDGDALDLLWLADYMPELITAERQRYPAIQHIREVLGGTSTVTPVAVPADCVDGFTEAFFARPERFLDPAVRQSQSAWGFVEEAATERGVARLRADLDSGAWDRRYGTLRTQPEFTGSLRLITAQPG